MAWWPLEHFNTFHKKAWQLESSQLKNTEFAPLQTDAYAKTWKVEDATWKKQWNACLLYCDVVVNIAVQDDFSNDIYAGLKFSFLSTLGRQIKKIGDIFFTVNTNRHNKLQFILVRFVNPDFQCIA